MSEPEYPKLDLAQIVLKAVALYTGRAVVGTEVYALQGNYLQVTIELREDDSVHVELSDPASGTSGQAA